MINVEQNGETVNTQHGEIDTQHDSDEEMSDIVEPKLLAIQDLPASDDDTVGHKFSVTKVDKATQTDPELPTLQDTLTSDTLPHLTSTSTTITPSSPHTSQPYTLHKCPQLPTVNPMMSTFASKRPHTAGGQTKTYVHPKSASAFSTQTEKSDWLHTTNVHTPRSAVSTRRTMTTFSKTEAIRQFHERHPDNVPDLRDYSIQEGRRHVIHGHHAYYFH